MTYYEIYKAAIKNLSLNDDIVDDYRPASPFFITELKEQIPNAIIIWLKSGKKIIYIENNKGA